MDVIADFNASGSATDRFLFRSSNFAGLTNSGTTLDFTSFIVRNIGSSGDNISKQSVILFESKFDNAQAVNAVLKNQNGSSKTGAFFVYLNNTFNKYVLGFDPNVADDSLPAFDLGVLNSIPTVPEPSAPSLLHLTLSLFRVSYAFFDRHSLDSRITISPIVLGDSNLGKNLFLTTRKIGGLYSQYRFWSVNF